MSEIVDCIAFIVRKAFWSLWVFLSFLFFRLLDLLGLVFNILACCTIVRLPAMVMQFKDMKSFAEWRGIGFVQLCIFISDIPIMIMSLILMVTLWRLYPTYKELKEKWDGRWCRNGIYYSGFAVRGVIIKHFFTLFVDAFCVPSGLLTLISWRCVIFVREIRKAKDDWERRKICFVQFFQLLFDVLCLAGFLVTLLSWRLPFVVRKISSKMAKDEAWDKIRVVGLANMPVMLVDVPCILAFLLALISWRAPIMIWNMSKMDGTLGSSRWQWRVRREACAQVIYLVLDMPCIVFAAIILITLWRSGDLVKRIKGVSRRQFDDFVDKEFEIRGICCKEFAMILVDLFSVFLLMFTFITVWRVPTLLRRLRKYNSSIRVVATDLHHCISYDDQLSQRGIVMQEFGMIFVDLLFFIVFIVLICTLWRIYPVIRDIRKYLRQYTKDKPRVAALESRSTADSGRVGDQGGSTAQTGAQDILVDELSPLRMSPTSMDEYGSTYNAEASGADRTGEARDSALVDDAVMPAKVSSISDAGSAEHASGSQAPDLITLRVADKTLVNPPGEVLVNQTDEDVREEAQDEDKPPLTWSKCMWKIRKAIGLNFVFLCLDLPAIPLVLVLLVTALRLPSLLSSLLASSNFYLEFAVTVYYQTFRLFVDLLFLILFFILIVLRPVTTWVCVFEDEEHEKYRKLCEIKLWVPDIISGRHKVHDAMENIVSRAIKAMDGRLSVELRLQDLSKEYISKCEKILERLKEADIEDEYVHLLQCVVFWERKRVGKLMRRYQVEHAYLLRPDVSLHNSNQHRLNHELALYESTVSAQYKGVSTYVVAKVPLWRQRSGFSIRTREETQKVLIQCLPRGTIFLLMTAFLCCLPLYRAPTMIKRLCRKWYARSSIILGTVKEYGLDVLTLLRILVVLVFLYRAPMMIADILDCLVEKRSWKAVRSVMKRYPPEMMEDLVRLVIGLFSWDTPRFLISALLFGLFMPAELFITVIRIVVKTNCLAYLLTALLYFFFMAFPMVMSLYLGHYLLAFGLGWANVVILCVFLGALLLTLLLMIVALVKDGEKVFLLAMRECDYIRLNWYNVHVVLFEVIEFFQMALLLFKLRVPMYGGAVLYTASTYVLFSFLPFYSVFYMTVAAFILWFFICGAPIILENILKSYPVGTFGKKMSWRLAVSLFSNTLFVTIIQTCSSFAACTYQQCPSWEVLGNISANSTCLRSVLVEDSLVNCWVGAHRGYAAFGLVALVWYGTTSLIVGTKYGDPDGTDLDMGFAPLYNNVINVLKGVMVVCASIVTTNNDVVAGVLLAFYIICLIFTLLFKSVFGYSPANLPSILVWRASTFFTCSVVSVAVIVAYRLDDAGSKVPLIILGVGGGVSLIASLAISLRLRTVSRVMKDRESFRTEIRQLEERLVGSKQVFAGWSRQQNIWRRLVRSVRSAKRDDRVYVKPVWTSAEDRLAAFKVDRPMDAWSPLPPPVPPPDLVRGPDYRPSSQEASGHSDRGEVVDLAMSPPPPPVLPYATAFATNPQSPLFPDSASPPPPLAPPPESLLALATDPPASPAQIQPQAEPPQPPTPPPLPASVSPPAGAPPNERRLSSPFLSSPDEHLRTPISVPELAALPGEIIRIEKNGRNLLVFLESFIHYESYSYSFMAQRGIWLNSVWQSNWTGLLECLRILDSNLTSSYCRPTGVDILLGSKSVLEDELQEDLADKDVPPVFVPETKEMIEQRSRDVREKALSDFASVPVHGERWSKILDLVLPSLPVLREWSFDESGTFEIKLRRPVCGTITAVGPLGAKLAIGAQVRISQKVMRGRIAGGRLVFDKGFGPTGHKGPVKVSVQEIQFVKRKGKWYVESEGKKVKFDVAMDTCQTVVWT